MREILFRGKRVDNGEWIRGDLITTPFIRNETQQNIIYILDITKADYDCFEDFSEENGIFEVDPSTVCQYTGLTDREGKKIFKGDICKYYNSEDKDGIAVIKEDYAEWVSGTIHEKEIMTPLFYLKCSKEWEVIGNIFDNPELIGE